MRLPMHMIVWTMFICNPYSCPLEIIVLGKFIALLIQLISAVLVVDPNITPSVVIALGIVGFIFGFLEGGLNLWRL